MKRAKNVIDIETKINNGLVVIGSDIHIPFQDDKAVACFVRYCKEKQPETIVLNGDVLDMFMLSKFTKGEGRNPLEEITMCRGLLEMIRKACPTSEIYYVIGNHENRLEKYVLSKAPELASLIEDVFSNDIFIKYQNIFYFFTVMAQGMLIWQIPHIFNTINEIFQRECCFFTVEESIIRFQ